jgi:integrase
LKTSPASRTKGLATIVQIAMETGLRKGELLGLTWERLDLSRGVIRLEGRAHGESGGTKSGKRREVPMRQVVYDLLAALPEPVPGGSGASRNIRTAFESAVKAAGHFHDLRHHFASWYIMRGGSLPSLQQILGHADLKMTLRYAHLAPEHLRSEIAKTERPAPTLVAQAATDFSARISARVASAVDCGLPGEGSAV